VRDSIFPAVRRIALGALGVGLAATSFAQGIDFSRPVVIGDSLSAGYQNGSLHEAYQPKGFANLVAKQARASLDLPRIAGPGVPNTLMFVAPGPPPVIGPAPGTSSGRVDPMLQTFDLAVPGHDVQDALTTRPDLPVDDLTDLVLGLPGLLQGVSRSQVEWAEALSPSVVLVWLGSNDALGAALNADPTLVTPTGQFAASLAEVLDRLDATGATIVVGNVPDVATIPYLTSAEEIAAQAPSVPPATVFALLGIGEGDFVIPAGLPYVAAILGQQQAGPLNAAYVFDAGEVQSVRMAIDVYNAVIAMEARAHGAMLVDVHGLLERLDANGVVLGDARLSTAFLGGLFSLDGVHPTDTAYAILANAFIDAMNDQADAGLARIDVLAVAASDPLVFALGKAPDGCSPDPESARELIEMVGR